MLIRFSQAAGAEHVSDLSKIGRRTGRNMHRDLMRRLAKRSQWPKLYYVPVKCWSNRLQTHEVVDIPVALPHEMFNRIAIDGDPIRFADASRLSEQAQLHLEKAKFSMGSGPPIVPLGLWLDETPCNWDRIWPCGFPLSVCKHISDSRGGVYTCHARLRVEIARSQDTIS